MAKAADPHSSLRGAAVQSRLRPWLMLTAALWLQVVTGGSYDFSIYSQSIKDSFGLTQQSLDSISVAKDVGANVGIVSGLLYDRFGNWPVLATAAALALSGNLMMWLSIVGRVAVPPLWLACLYAFLAANSQTFSNTAAVVTCVKTFPSSRGTIVGLLKGALGISGAVLVQVNYLSFGDDGADFPLLMAILAPVSCMCAMLAIRTMPEVRASDGQERRLKAYSAILFVLAAYLLVVIMVQNYMDVGRAWRAVVVGGIVLILSSPLWMVFRTDLLDKDEDEDEEDEADGTLKERLLPPPANSSSKLEPELGTVAAHEADRAADSAAGATADAGLVAAMLSLDFWLLFFTSACGMGSGLTTINNMSQIGSSLGYSSQEITTFVSLWSLWNFGGRLGGGYVSEHFLHSNRVPRPVFILITLGAMAAGHVVIALAFPGALYIGPVIVGTCYGAQWSLMPATASEIFGLSSFGSIFNTIAVASPLSSYVLSIKVTGYLYDLEADAGTSSCSGAHCFRLSFFIMAAVCVAGSCASLALISRTRPFYRASYFQR